MTDDGGLPEDIDGLRAALADRTLQLSVLFDALRERDRKDAAQREWDFALQLQTGDLPNDYPAFPGRSEFDVRGGMVTAFEVGGDVYDFYFIDDRRLGFVVADASGKGLPAAMFITNLRSMLRPASQRVADPAACLTLVNRLMCFDNPEMLFATAFYGVLDTTTGEVAFTNAGHNPPLHITREGVVTPVKHVRAPMLGMFEQVVYRTGALALAPGDTLCCFSDGITEAHNANRELFGDARLCETFANHAGADLVTLEAQVVGAVDRFIGSAAIADDLTLLLLRWNGKAAT
jgi:sigma-B regulation protein RsbU (phosphoserine phosphatase)